MDSVPGGDFGDTERGTPFNDIHYWNSRFLFFYVCHETQLSLAPYYWTSTKTGIHSRNDQGCYVLFILSEIYSELRIRRHAVSWMEWKTKTLQESHTESPWLVNPTSKWQFARCCCSAWSGRSDGKLTQRHCLHMLIQINFLEYLDC